MSLLDDYTSAKDDFKKSLKRVALYSLAASFAMLAMPAFLFQVYDKVLISRSFETLIAMYLIVLVILMAYGVFDSVRHAILSREAVKAESKIIGPVLAAELHRESDARLATIQDIVTVRQTLASPTFGALFDLPMMPLFMIIVFLVNVTLGFLLLLAAVGLFALALYSSKKTAPHIQELTSITGESNQTLEDVLRSHEMIRAQGMYREAVTRWGDKHAKLLEKSSFTYTLTQTYASVSKAVRQIIQVSLIGGGALLVLNDLASPGIIFAVSIIGSRALAPMEQLLGGWRSLKQGQAALGRLEDRLGDLTLPENRTPLPAPKGTIRLNRVAYTPRPGVPPIIRGISATIEQGDRVAIIGPSGAGKSTLARMMIGYLPPSAGDVSLDGQKLGNWDPIMRGLYMGYMPQEITFLEGTVAENISRLRSEDDTDMVIDAARIAGVHDFILTLPQGYDTVLKKGQYWPSGGQAAMIALARAYYGRPRVLILDEPNASLDSEGEKAFHQSLTRAAKLGMTVILVTHRPTPMPFMTKVMLMEQGLIKDFGPKEEILGNKVKITNTKGEPVKNQTQQHPEQQQAASKSASKAAPKADAKPVDTPKPAEGEA